MAADTNLEFNFNRIKEFGAKSASKNTPADLKEPRKRNTDGCSRSLDVDLCYPFYL